MYLDTITTKKVTSKTLKLVLSLIWSLNVSQNPCRLFLFEIKGKGNGGGGLYAHPGRRGGYALISYVCSQHCIQSLLRPIDRQAEIPKEIQKENIYR